MYRSSDVYAMLKEYRYEFEDEYELISTIKCDLLNEELQDYIYVNGKYVDLNISDDKITCFMNDKYYIITIKDNLVLDYDKS